MSGLHITPQWQQVSGGFPWVTISAADHSMHTGGSSRGIEARKRISASEPAANDFGQLILIGSQPQRIVVRGGDLWLKSAGTQFDAVVTLTDADPEAEAGSDSSYGINFLNDVTDVHVDSSTQQIVLSRRDTSTPVGSMILRNAGLSDPPGGLFRTTADGRRFQFAESVADCRKIGMSPDRDATTNGDLFREAVAYAIARKAAVYVPGAPAPYVCAPATTGSYLAVATGGVTGLTIFGDGMGVTRLQCVAGMDSGFLNFTNSSGIIVRDLTCDCNFPNQLKVTKPHGIRFDGSNDVEVSHVELIDIPSYGIGFQGTASGENSSRVILAYNRIYRSGIDGIDIKNPTPNANQTWVITGNYIEDHDYGRPDNDGAGIDCRAPAFVTNNEIRFTNSLSNGTGMRSRIPDGGTGTPGGGKKTRFIGNRVVANAGYVTAYGTFGVAAEDDYTTAIGNFTENIQNAYSVSGNGTQFIGNTAVNPIRGFFCYANATNAIVAENIVINPSLEGARVDGCTNLTFRGNKIVGTSLVGTTGFFESVVSPGTKFFENEVTGMAADVFGFATAPMANNTGRWPGVGATAISGVTLEHLGGTVSRRTVFTFTNVHMPLTDTAGVVARGGLKIFDFPEGVILIAGMTANLAITKSSTGVNADWDGDFATGTITAAGDATLAGFEANFIPTTATPQAVAGATTAKGYQTTSTILNGSTSPVDLYLNILVDDVDHDVTTTPCDLIINGTLIVSWTNMGDF